MRKKSSSRILLVLTVVFLASCTAVQKRPERMETKRRDRVGDVGRVEDRPQEAAPVAEPADEESMESEPEETPPPVVVKPPPKPKVGLILGPGSMRAYAHAGFIHEMHKLRIPVDAVVGLEWGALVGALYAARGEPHDVDWKLFKLKRDLLPSKGGFFKGTSSTPIEKLDDYLDDAFGRQKIENFRVPFACPSLSSFTGQQSWSKKGEAGEAVKRCMPYPPVLKGNGAFASAFAVPEAIDFLRTQGVELVILVNVIADGNLLKGAEVDQSALILWSELRRSMLRTGGSPALARIDIPLSEFSVVDFDKRQSIAPLGARASSALQALARKYGF